MSDKVIHKSINKRDKKIIKIIYNSISYKRIKELNSTSLTD